MSRNWITIKKMDGSRHSIPEGYIRDISELPEDDDAECEVWICARDTLEYGYREQALTKHDDILAQMEGSDLVGQPHEPDSTEETPDVSMVSSMNLTSGPAHISDDRVSVNLSPAEIKSLMDWLDGCDAGETYWGKGVKEALEARLEDWREARKEFDGSPSDDYTPTYVEKSSVMDGLDVSWEGAVLGRMILSPEYLEKSLDEIGVDYFEEERHGKIYHAIEQIVDERSTLDLILLRDKLRDNGDLTAVGGVGYLQDLMESVASSEPEGLKEALDNILEETDEDGNEQQQG